MRLLRPLFCINQRKCTDHSRHARSVIKAVARTTNAKIIENATLCDRILTIYCNYRSYKAQSKILFERSFNATHCRSRDERVEKRQNEIGRLQSPRKAAGGVSCRMFVDGFRQNARRRTGGFSALRIRLDLIGDRGECPELSLLLWCLSVPEALTTGPISGEVRRRK